MSFLLDVLAAILSGGLSTYRITKEAVEHSPSQVFSCIDPSKLHNKTFQTALYSIIDDYHQPEVISGKSERYPGEGALKRREENLQRGIPVLKTVWDEILSLQK